MNFADLAISPLNDKVISYELQKIYRTTAKLFYDNKDHLEIVLEELKLIGFNILIRHPFVIYKEKRTVLVPDEKFAIEYKKCECGENNIQLPRKMIEKIITIDVKHYFND